MAQSRDHKTFTAAVAGVGGSEKACLQASNLIRSLPMKSLTSRPSFGAYSKASAMAGVVAAPLTVMANFSGDYAVTPPAGSTYSNASATGTFGNWTGTWNGFGTLNLNTSLEPSQISMSIGDPIADPGNYTFLVQAAASGLVSFDYMTVLGGPNSVSASAKFIDQTTSTSTALAGSGPFSMAVTAGDLFGFQISYGYQANVALTISDFSAPEPPPSTGVPDQASTLGLLTFGFVGLLAYRAAARRRAVIGA
jgi:hypothetical protein